MHANCRHETPQSARPALRRGVAPASLWRCCPRGDHAPARASIRRESRRKRAREPCSMMCFRGISKRLRVLTPFFVIRHPVIGRRHRRFVRCRKPMRCSVASERPSNSGDKRPPRTPWTRTGVDRSHGQHLPGNEVRAVQAGGFLGPRSRHVTPAAGVPHRSLAIIERPPEDSWPRPTEHDAHRRHHRPQRQARRFRDRACVFPRSRYSFQICRSANMMPCGLLFPYCRSWISPSAKLYADVERPHAATTPAGRSFEAINTPSSQTSKSFVGPPQANPRWCHVSNASRISSLTTSMCEYHTLLCHVFQPTSTRSSTVRGNPSRADGASCPYRTSPVLSETG